MSLRGFRRERFGGDGAGEALVAAAGAERLAANAGALPTSHENNEKLVAAGHGYSVPLRRQRVPLFLPSHTLHVAPRWSCVLSFRHVPQALRGCCSSGRTALPLHASLWKAVLAFSVSGEPAMLVSIVEAKSADLSGLRHWPSGCVFITFLPVKMVALGGAWSEVTEVDFGGADWETPAQGRDLQKRPTKSRFGGNPEPNSGHEDGEEAQFHGRK